jgi:hypothetical protein
MGRQMREDLQGGSEVLKQLQARQLQTSQAGFGASAQPATRFYNLAGSLDVLVLPSKHIISKKAFWSCWLPHVGHYSILMSETFWDQVSPRTAAATRQPRLPPCLLTPPSVPPPPPPHCVSRPLQISAY